MIARWITKSGTGEGHIDMRLFDGTGKPIGGTPILISDKTGANFQFVDSFGSAFDADGNILVVWHGCDADGDGNACGVKGRFVSGTGPVGDELVIPTTLTGDQKAPSAVALGHGAFAVAWNDFSAQQPDVSGAAVRARIIYAN